MKDNSTINQNILTENLKTKWLAKKLVYLPDVDSTNQEVKRIASDYPHGTAVVAEYQTTGKGRLGRIWSSPKGTGLWFSILLKPEIAPEQLAGITLACGLGVCKAIRQYTGLNALIKWPNDIIVGNKKICGILTEMKAEADKIIYAVAGIGINVNTAEFDEDIKHKATSLSIEANTAVDRAELFKEIMLCLEKSFDDYFSEPDSAISDEYIKLCATLGRNVAVARGNTTFNGKAVGVEATGDLLVEISDGTVIKVSSGEVTVQGIY
ncbi:MAG: biotin--[Clostridia bacterium]|nr:biotin--[acetyl-CoA-carboxylase] ligase [Clostridia bacterium]